MTDASITAGALSRLEIGLLDWLRHSNSDIESHQLEPLIEMGLAEIVAGPWSWSGDRKFYTARATPLGVEVHDMALAIQIGGIAKALSEHRSTPAMPPVPPAPPQPE